MINNSSNDLGALGVNVKSPDLKISVRIIMHHPLQNLEENVSRILSSPLRP